MAGGMNQYGPISDRLELTKRGRDESERRKREKEMKREEEKERGGERSKLRWRRRRWWLSKGCAGLRRPPCLHILSGRKERRERGKGKKKTKRDPMERLSGSINATYDSTVVK